MDTNDATQQPDVIVRGRHLELGEFWVEHVREKTVALARFGLGISRFDVEVTREANPRQASQAWQVEVAAITRGTPIRAKGAGEKAEIAFERARETLEHQLRRAAKRGRWSRHGSGATAKVARLLRG
ncbi:MAG: HPF/RaiA family ribosome-associated protein [Candidatus Nanopelagicales bacterium]